MGKLSSEYGNIFCNRSNLRKHPLPVHKEAENEKKKIIEKRLNNNNMPIDNKKKS